MADAQANINININTADALAQIRALQRQIAVFHSSLAKGGALAGAEAAQMQQSLINSINATGKFSASMTSVRSTTESFTNALEKNKLSMGEYFRFAGGSSRTFGKLFAKEFTTIDKVARERVKTLQTQFITMGRDANGALQAIKVRPLALDMDNLGTRVMMASQKQQIFNQLIRQGSTNLLNFGKNTQWAGRQLMVGFTIPLTMFGVAAARSFQQIEEQVIKFRRVYGDMFTTDADTEKALKNVRDLADEFTKYGIAVEKTIDLAAKVAQMGNVGAALEQQVTQATRLSVLGGMEQMDALDTTISLTNAFGVSIEDLGKKIDFLNAAENQTILAIEDFNTAIPLAGSVVNQLGGNVEDLAVLLTAMREAGINASQSGNALKSSLARLIAPSRNAKDTLSGFGIDVLAIVENNAGNLMGTINALALELDRLDPLSRARSIEALFGKFQFARMSALFQNISREGSQANKVLQLTQQSAEELQILANRELGRVEESAATKFQKVIEKFQTSLAPIGEQFLKAVTPLVEFGTKILNMFNNLGEGTKQFLVNIVGIGGVIAPVFIMSFGLIANFVANFIKSLAFLGNIFGMLSGQSKLLGGGIDYLTQEQLEANAVAGSLEQSHIRLNQLFTSEASSVNMLADAYRNAIIASRGFGGVVGPVGVSRSSNIPGFAKGGKVRKYSSGGLILGPGTGTSDSIPAMVSNGEFIVSAEKTKEYLPLLKEIVAGNVPKFASEISGGSLISTGATDPQTLRSTNTFRGYTSTVGWLDQNINQQLKPSSGGANPAELAANMKQLGAGMLAQLMKTIAREMGATSSAEILAMIADESTGIKALAQRIVNASVSEVASSTSNITDPELATIVQKNARDQASAAGGAFETATEKWITQPTTFEDRTQVRLRGNGSFDSVGRAQLYGNVPDYKSESQLNKAIAMAAGTPEDLLQDSVQAHFALPGRFNMSEAAAYGELSGQAAAAQQRSEADVIRVVPRKGMSPEDMVSAVDASTKYKRVLEENADEIFVKATEIGNAIGEGAIGGAESSLQIGSPSKRMFDLGKNAGDSLANGFESSMSGSDGATGPLTPPAPPPSPPTPKPTTASKIKGAIFSGVEKAGDTKVGRAIHKKLAKASGVAAADSQGNIFYDPNEDPSTKFGKMEAEKSAMPKPPSVADGVIPVKIVDGYQMDPNLEETFDRGTIETENLADSLKKNTKANDDQAKAVQKEANRQRRQKLASGAFGALGTATVVSGFLSQRQDVAGEIARGVMPLLGGLTAIVPILTALPGPLALLVLVVGGAAAAFFALNNHLKGVSKEAFELSKSLGVGRDAMQKFADFAGKVSATEILEKRREARLSPFQVQPGETTFGEAFVQSDQGAELVEATKKGIVKLGKDETVRNLYLQLGSAVSQGLLTADQARSVAGSIGREVGDLDLFLQINSKLLTLFGPNGENLLEDPLQIQFLLAGEIEAGVESAVEEYQRVQAALESQSILPGGAGATRLDPTLRTEEVDTMLAQERERQLAEASGAWERFLISIKPEALLLEELKAANLGKLTSVLSSSFQNYESALDTARLASEDRIQKEIEAGASVERIQELRRQEADELESLVASFRTQNQKLVSAFMQLTPADQARTLREQRERIISSQEEGQRGTAANVLTGLSDVADISQRFVIQSAIESGALSVSDTKELLSSFGEPKQIEAFIDLMGKVGAGESAQILKIASAIQDGTLKDKFFLTISSAEEGDVLDKLRGFEYLTQTSALFDGIDIPISYYTENEEQFDNFIANADMLRVASQNGELDFNLYTQIFGAETAIALQDAINANREQWDSFESPQQIEFAILYAMQAQLLGTQEAKDQLAATFPTLGQGQAAYENVARVIPSLRDTTRVTEDGGEGDGAGGGGTETFDSLLKQLRDLRIATIDMKRGWDGMMESLQKVFAGGTQAINVFDGLANQIRRFGVGENLIEMIVGMDPDEYEKRKKDLFTFDKAGNITGTTAKLKNMQAAFNAIALGEYVNEQQRSLQTMRDQISAISVLTANGLSLAEAYELVQNEALAAAVAMGATKEEIAEIVRLTQEIASLRKKVEREDERAQAAKAVRKTNEEFEKRVQVLSKLSKAAGQYTDEQIDAIFSDSNLQTLFLNPSIDQNALNQAIYNASRNAEIELQVRLQTATGQQGVFEEGFSKAMEAFATQEQTINLKFQAEIEEDENIARAAESQIAALQFQLDDYQAEITRIEDQEKDINDAYEKRFEALDKVAQANERIAAAQKSQLDIADALTRGDIAAAARAAQEARAQQAQSAQQTERERLEQARDAQIERLTGRGGMNREQLEEQIRQLEMQIFNIEEDDLEPAQERIRIAEEARDAQIRSLEVLGKTRLEWEQIKNSIDVATMNSWQFVEAMETALSIVEQLIESLGRPKPVPPPPPPPAPTPSGGGGPAPAPAPAPAPSPPPARALSAAEKAAQWSANISDTIRNLTSENSAEPAPAPPPRPAAPRPTTSVRALSDTASRIVAGTGTSARNDPLGIRKIISPSVSSAITRTANAVKDSVVRAATTLGSKISNSFRNVFPNGIFQKRTVASGGMIKKYGMGGKVKGYPMGGLIPYKAAGGFFKSLGSDTIPAMLTPGEFVVRRPAVRGFGVENLEKINNGTYDAGSMYNYNLTVNVKSSANPDIIARTVMKSIERVESQRVRGNRI